MIDRAPPRSAGHLRGGEKSIAAAAGGASHPPNGTC
jgi:hypothetical protein